MVQKNRLLNRVNQKSIVWDIFLKSNGKKKPLVIFCHGYKGFKDWGSWDLVAQEFLKANMVFVKFNFSHNGGTIKQPIDFPDLEAFAENNYTKELNDLNDILNYLSSEKFGFKNEINTNNITVIGHSRAGGIATIKASEDSRITNLITWASVCDFGKRTMTIGNLKQWKKDGVKYVLNGRTKQQMPHNYQFYEDFKTNEKRLHIKSAAKNITIPHLIVHGKNDDAISFSEAESLHSWNAKSELFLVENTNHVFNSKHPLEKDKLPEELQLVVNKSIQFIQ